MEENFSHMIEMAMAVLLFIFGLTVAVLSYNRINAYASEFMAINSENRRGRASDDRLSNKTDTNNNIQREVDYGEIIMTIMNLKKNVLRDGNGSPTYHRVLIKKGGNVYLVHYDGLIHVVASTASQWKNSIAGSEIGGPYNENNLNRLISDLSSVGIANSKAKYTISYDKDNSALADAANVIIYTSK